MDNQDKKTLENMFVELKKAPSIFQPSNFWDKLNDLHIDYLSRVGFENFKRTIGHHYFGWGVLSIIRHQLSPILEEIKRGNFSPIFESHFKNGINPLATFIYRVYVASLFEYVSKIDRLNILKKIEEPLLGNPFIVTYKGKKISQDLCNSVYEFYSITQKIKLSKNARIADIGAGYGRLAYIFLNVIPDCSYCIIDIPPALFISQKYLKTIFPREKIFLFRPFSSYKDIKSEFDSSRIKFLLPHQLELFPDKHFDLFINISSLHEMMRSQIKNYIELINRLCRGYFYTKQWRKSETKDNLYIKESEYPIPQDWKIISRNSPHPIQRMFFDTLYKL